MITIDVTVTQINEGDHLRPCWEPGGLSRTPVHSLLKCQYICQNAGAVPEPALQRLINRQVPAVIEHLNWRPVHLAVRAECSFPAHPEIPSPRYHQVLRIPTTGVSATRLCEGVQFHARKPPPQHGCVHLARSKRRRAHNAAFVGCCVFLECDACVEGVGGYRWHALSSGYACVEGVGGY